MKNKIYVITDSQGRMSYFSFEDIKEIEWSTKDNSFLFYYENDGSTELIFVNDYILLSNEKDILDKGFQ